MSDDKPRPIGDDAPICECQKPCHPETDCPHCADYWQQMRDDGMWVDGMGWTDKAIKEMCSK